jgi:DNA-binding CsgD family transcriptional regulator
MRSVFFFKKTDGASKNFFPIKPTDSDTVLIERVSRLSGDEEQIYKWLCGAYSLRWIAETLLLDKRETRKLIEGVCFKLGVRNEKELFRVYSRLPRPAGGIVDTEEIDHYVDERPMRAPQNTDKGSPNRSESPPDGTNEENDQ